MLYGTAAWDPVLIIAQILTLQCLFYLTIGLAQAIFLGPFIAHLSIAYIFNWRSVEVHNTVGWMNVASNLATACLGAIYLMWIVERAKKCVDFASTTYVFHLTVTWILWGFPASLVWWTTNGVGLLVMALLGEWLCVQKELQDIPLGSARGRSAAASGGGTAGTSSSSQPSRGGGGSNSGSGRGGPRRSDGETAPLLEMVTVTGGSGSGSNSAPGASGPGTSGSTAMARLVAAGLGGAKPQPGPVASSPRGQAGRTFS